MMRAPAWLMVMIGGAAARSCEDLQSSGYAFKYAVPESGICAASRMPNELGETGCAKNSIGFAAASIRCATIGARLCTGQELHANLAKGVGCQLDTKGSFCWTLDDPVAAGCSEGQHIIRRCKQASSGPLCAPDSYMGSLKCCAEGSAQRFGDEPAEPPAILPDTAVCAKHICGAECADEPGCGWSTARGRCIPGKKTSNKERAMGDCSQRGATCKDNLCGADCAAAAGCGWSSTRGLCVAGASTSKAELTKGICPDVVDCAAHACGADCAAVVGCGWSTQRMQCVNGGRTSKQELLMGECGPTEAPPVDCSGHTCGATCAEAPGCGWSTGAMACKAGKATSTEERSMGDCGDSVGGADADPGPCEDLVADWKDGDGDMCVKYQYMKWCTAEGGYGPAWSSDSTWESFANAAGETANVICCACGGGTVPFSAPTTTAAPTTVAITTVAPTTTIITTQPTTAATVATETEAACADWYDSWTDADGDGCTQYADNLYCENGGTGSRWQPEEDFSMYVPVDAPDAGDVCCVCGGGSAGNAPTEPPAEERLAAVGGMPALAVGIQEIVVRMEYATVATSPLALKGFVKVNGKVAARVLAGVPGQSGRFDLLLQLKKPLEADQEVQLIVYTVVPPATTYDALLQIVRLEGTVPPVTAQVLPQPPAPAPISQRTCSELVAMPTLYRVQVLRGVAVKIQDWYKPPIEGVCAATFVAGACPKFVGVEGATQRCTSIGARLCTEDELLTNVAQGTGCQGDTMLTWTLDRCGDGFVAATSKLGGAVETDCFFGDAGGISVRCCADAD